MNLFIYKSLQLSQNAQQVAATHYFPLCCSMKQKHAAHCSAILNLNCCQSTLIIYKI